jgi:hypothetical protein
VGSILEFAAASPAEIERNLMDFAKYYGADWIAMVLSVASLWMLGSRKRSGFVMMAVGNAAWIIYGVMAKNLPVVISNAVFVVLNLRGYVKWLHTPEKS